MNRATRQAPTCTPTSPNPSRPAMGPQARRNIQCGLPTSRLARPRRLPDRTTRPAKGCRVVTRPSGTPPCQTDDLQHPRDTTGGPSHVPHRQRSPDAPSTPAKVTSRFASVTARATSPLGRGSTAAARPTRPACSPLTGSRPSTTSASSGPSAPAWEQYLAAAAFRAREGHLRVPTKHREAGLELGTWMYRMRCDRDAGRLHIDRVRALTGLGMLWDSRHQPWSQRLAAARAYRTREGHLHVPGKHCEGDVQLGRWIIRWRIANTAGTLPADQVQALTDLGLHWSPRRGPPRPLK